MHLLTYKKLMSLSACAAMNKYAEPSKEILPNGHIAGIIYL